MNKNGPVLQQLIKSNCTIIIDRVILFSLFVRNKTLWSLRLSTEGWKHVYYITFTPMLAFSIIVLQFIWSVSLFYFIKGFLLGFFIYLEFLCQLNNTELSLNKIFLNIMEYVINVILVLCLISLRVCSTMLKTYSLVS